MPDIALSIVVISYNMARELPRTLLSLSPVMQRDIAADDYEVILVDNGSATPPRLEDFADFIPNLRIHAASQRSPSPVGAINEGLAMARGRLVGVFIDGARMASPRLLATALEAARGQDRPVIGTLAFHLGPEVQSVSVTKGYCQAVEDELLATVDWQADAYKLFNISVFAGSSQKGWFVIPAETNALFATREHWQALGGYDPAFVSPGGGLANLDIWERLCAGNEVTLLLGEATFHQFHGGIATNSTVDHWPEFHAEYMAIRGKRYSPPSGTPRLYGQLVPEAMPSVRLAARDRHTMEAAALSVAGRPFSSRLPPEILDGIQNGTMTTVYRGVPFFKSPLDIALYLQLLSRLAPRTVFEVGTKFGGSALWFADMLTAQELDAGVVSVDISPLAAYTDPRIVFLEGDAKALGRVLSDDLLAGRPHPWLVVEDSSHFYAESMATLEFFHGHLRPGDYIVVEDGVVGQLSAEPYRKYDNGPSRAIIDFMAKYPGCYEVDARLCDHFGFNATYNPNGWLRRIA